MKGTILYGPRDVRFEDRPGPEDRKADRRHHPHFSYLRLRFRPVAVSRYPKGRSAHAHGPRVLRSG